MRSLPLFHQIAGQPVIVLGEGEAAQAKRRLVERAGGIIMTEIGEGVDKGARLAFVAHQDALAIEADALRLRGLGLLVNVVDRPQLCDFTTPSVLDRDPLLIAIGTGGASAGLAKAVRLRLERLLPQRLGQLAERLQQAREQLRARWPDPSVRRRALDAALGEGGQLDPLVESSADALESWLHGDAEVEPTGPISIMLASDDPEELTLRQARLLGSADAILHDPSVPTAILDRARTDALRLPLPHAGVVPTGLVIILQRI